MEKKRISIYVSSRAKQQYVRIVDIEAARSIVFTRGLLEDLPFMGKETRIIFKARKMFLVTNGSCFRKTFAEQPERKCSDTAEGYEGAR